MRALTLTWHLKLSLDRQLREVALSTKTGAVDQNINFRAVCFRVLENAGRRFWLGEIGSENFRLGFVGLPQLIRQGLERMTLTRQQDESGAIGGEASGQFATDAGRGSSDQDSFGAHIDLTSTIVLGRSLKRNTGLTRTTRRVCASTSASRKPGARR